MALIVPLPDGNTLRIAPGVLETMWGFTQIERKDAEAGGVLIGHQRQTSNEIILDRLTTPQPGDRRSRHRFHRGQAEHQAMLDLQWLASERTRTYLGEWHTHPEDHPAPSGIDRREWAKILASAGGSRPELLFIIIGQQTTRVWRGTFEQQTPVLVTECTTGDQRLLLKQEAQ